MDIVKELRGGAEDPMWDAHCEMPKRVAKAAADEIIRLRRIESAAEQVLAGLNQRIDAAPDDAKPVFHGIAELHTAISSSSR